MTIHLTSAELTAAGILSITRLAAGVHLAVENAVAAKSRTLVARIGDSISGAVAWSPLPWDSSIFGFPAARLDFIIAAESRPAIFDQLCAAAIADARACGIRHLTARAPSSEIDAIQALERAGFETIDAIQTFSLQLNGHAYLEGPARNAIRDYQPADLDALCEIARTAYRFDRFHADTALPPGAADRAHAEWVRNSCLGRAADHVIVATQYDAPAGYVTCKLNRTSGIGVIVLVATSERARGRGLARAATCGSLDWFRSQGASSVDVGTQFRNIPAARLYESCGFRLSATSVTLRRML